MKLFILFFLITATLTPASVLEQAIIESVSVISMVQDEDMADDSPKHLVKGKNVLLSPLIQVSIRGKKKWLSCFEGVCFRGHELPKKDVLPLTGNASAYRVRWLKVEPSSYNLSNTEGGWHWERIPYVETVFHKDEWSAKANVLPTQIKQFSECGTMRFKVEFRVNGKTFSSPGAESNEKSGISDKVHRISVKGNTGVEIIDWAYSFINLPYIWGSASINGKDSGHQSERYLGADCADFVVAAARKAGYKISYGGTFSLSPGNASRDTEYVVNKPTLGRDGFYRKNGKQILFGPGMVCIGDLVLYNRHVGILCQDNKPEGFLDSGDMVIHTLWKEPRAEPVSEAYSGPFSIIRFREIRKK